MTEECLYCDDGICYNEDSPHYCQECEICDHYGFFITLTKEDIEEITENWGRLQT